MATTETSTDEWDGLYNLGAAEHVLVNSLGKDIIDVCSCRFRIARWLLNFIARGRKVKGQYQRTFTFAVSSETLVEAGIGKVCFLTYYYVTLCPCA